MKKLLFIAAIFSLVIMNADAQQQGKRGHQNVNPEKRAEMQADRMADQLDLSEEQKSRIYEIHLDRAQAQQEMREAQRQERRAAMQETRQAQHAEVEEVLTPDQKLKWVELRNEDRERMEKYRDARGSENTERLKKHRKSKNPNK